MFTGVVKKWNQAMEYNRTASALKFHRKQTDWLHTYAASLNADMIMLECGIDVEGKSTPPS
ncbi:hypothetical protein M514_22359 [Trichuris suis]|uniref:Uncharacterized protein n=1 Tax=Trichuris suis TaxID=68888 RepID=A0A085N7I7_9BILA|nr:hypothetical protein M514_22359 [Trichuris suis]